MLFLSLIKRAKPKHISFLNNNYIKIVFCLIPFIVCTSTAFNFKIIQQSVLFILWIADVNASEDIEIRLQNIFHRIKNKDNCYLYCHHRISNIKVFLFIFCIFCLLLFLIVLITNGFRLLLFIVNQLVFWIFCFWLFFWFQFKARLFLPENKFQYQGYYQY